MYTCVLVVYVQLLSCYRAYYSRYFFYPGTSPYPSSDVSLSRINDDTTRLSAASPSGLSSSSSPSASRSPSFFSHSVAFLSTISLALALLVIQLGLWGMSLHLSHSRFSNISTSREACELAEFFLRFRLLFTLSSDQISLFSLMPWNRNLSLSSQVPCSSCTPSEFSSELSTSSSSSAVDPSSSPSPRPSSSPSSRSSVSSFPSSGNSLPPSFSVSSFLLSDLPRLLLPSLMPSDTSPQAALLKMSCLFLSTCIVQRTLGFYPTLIALSCGMAASPLVTLAAYSYLLSRNSSEADNRTTPRSPQVTEEDANALERENRTSSESKQTSSYLLSGTWGHLALASAIAVCTREQWPRSRAESSEKSSSPPTSASSSSWPLANRKTQSAKELHRKCTSSHLSTASVPPTHQGGTSTRGHLFPSIRRRIPSLWPQVPIAAAALAVPLFAEVIIRGPQCLEAFNVRRPVRENASTGKKAEQREGEAREREDEARRKQSGFRSVEGSQAVDEERASSEKQALPGQRIDQREQKEAGAKVLLEVERKQPSFCGHSYGETGAPASPPSPRQSPDSYALPSSATSLRDSKDDDKKRLMPHDVGVGNIQKQLLYHTCLVQGVETALEKQKERGDGRSRDLQKLKLASQVRQVLLGGTSSPCAVSVVGSVFLSHGGPERSVLMRSFLSILLLRVS